MSERSIAHVMGWTEARVSRRLQELHSPGSSAADEDEVGCDAAPAAPSIAAPIAAGEGLVVRTFHASPAGFAAACVLACGATAYVVTGRDPAKIGKRIRVERAGDVWRQVEAAADA